MSQPEKTRPKLSFYIDDKENIREYIRNDPAFMKGFLRTWIDIADHLLADQSMPQLILDTSKQLNIEAKELITGIIAGCLNEQLINEKLAPILGKDVLPVALLTMKGYLTTGEEAYMNWRRWYHLEEAVNVDADTIAKVIAGIMKYARFLDFDKLSEALESNQLIAFKGLADQQVKLLPFYPALEYQRQHMGEFKVGKFMPERNAGFFNCGEIEPLETHCPACGRRDLAKSKDEKHIYCRACNAGFKPKGETTTT